MYGRLSNRPVQTSRSETNSPDTRIMMQRFILENQGFIPRKLSNPTPNIKDLARFCQEVAARERARVADVLGGNGELTISIFALSSEKRGGRSAPSIVRKRKRPSRYFAN